MLHFQYQRALRRANLSERNEQKLPVTLREVAKKKQNDKSASSSLVEKDPIVKSVSTGHSACEERLESYQQFQN